MSRISILSLCMVLLACGCAPRMKYHRDAEGLLQNSCRSGEGVNTQDLQKEPKDLTQR